MNKVFVDTLFVVALINERDAYHARAAELADLCDGRPMVTTNAILLEIGNALAGSFKRQAVEVIDAFLASSDVEIVPLTPRLFQDAYSMYRKYQDKEWGLLDCVSFVVMREAGIRDALTFDHHFVQAGYNALMRD